MGSMRGGRITVARLKLTNLREAASFLRTYPIRDTVLHVGRRGMSVARADRPC